MNSINEKPLYTLTVGEFIELNKQILQEAQKSEPQNQFDIKPEMVDIYEASRIVNLSVPTMYAKTSKMQIPFYKNGKKLFFKRSELIAWIETGRRKTVAEIREEAFARSNQFRK